MSKSIRMYSKLAKSYFDYSQNRIHYLNSVDNIICHPKRIVNSYLDIGCGDERRSIKISSLLKCKNTTLFYNCP